jgi:hypothetical protein
MRYLMHSLKNQLFLTLWYLAQITVPETDSQSINLIPQFLLLSVYYPFIFLFKKSMSECKKIVAEIFLKESWVWSNLFLEE